MALTPAMPAQRSKSSGEERVSMDSRAQPAIIEVNQPGRTEPWPKTAGSRGFSLLVHCPRFPVRGFASKESAACLLHLSHSPDRTRTEQNRPEVTRLVTRYA